jgi:uncharacterized protein YdaU (DUF1376 family)
MSNNLYIPFHPGDYLADTAHLTTLEHGAYFLLILNYWQRGGPLPADDKKLRGIARLSPDEWAEARGTLLEFFVERVESLHHKRIDEELEKAREKSQRARESAERSLSVRRAKAARTDARGAANAQRALSDRATNADRTLSERAANQDQDQDQEAAEAASARAPAGEAKADFRGACLALVGEEPVLLAADFHVLERLVEEKTVTRADVLAGIQAAMAKPGFRIRHWSQLEGWARGATRQRLGGKAKTAASAQGPPAKALVWVAQGSDAYEAWRTARPKLVKALLTERAGQMGCFLPSERPSVAPSVSA